MRCLVTDQLVLSRAPEGPLSTYIRPFADLLSAQGYAPKSIHRQVHLAACFTERPVLRGDVFGLGVGLLHVLPLL
jgi:hypothetical protein